MITLSTRSGGRPLPLGSIVEVRVEKQSSDLEIRASLRVHPVCYPKPLRDWSAGDEPIRVHAESPGLYSVDVEWRQRSDDTEAGAEGHSRITRRRQGRETLQFSVDERADRGSKPTRARTIAGRLWVANAWEAKALAKDEKDIRKLVTQLVEPGDIVYDLGANAGFYAALFAQAAGANGHVYCVEPNPICVYLLRTNILEHRLANVEVLPVAVMHHEGATSFNVNYGNTTLGLSEASGLYPDKTGHEIAVPCFTLDALVERFGLLAPDLIKVDVEGVEELAVRGMVGVLERHRPKLLLELHHRECARAVLEQLEPLSYRYFEPETGAEVGTEEARARDGVFQLVARPA